MCKMESLCYPRGCNLQVQRDSAVRPAICFGQTWNWHQCQCCTDEEGRPCNEGSLWQHLLFQRCVWRSTTWLLQEMHVQVLKALRENQQHQVMFALDLALLRNPVVSRSPKRAPISS